MQEKLKLESIKNINKNIKLVPLLLRGVEGCVNKHAG